MNQNVIPLGLIARWAMATDDGDVQGGDLPGWLPELFGGALIASLADRRGECIHAACPHWRRCFIEHTIRRSRTAELVVANHALVMTQAAWGGLDDNVVPTRYVFDEGHHVFDAADSAFSASLSGARDGRTPPLAARCRGRPVTGPRAGQAAGGSGRRPPGPDRAAGGRVAGGHRTAALRLGEPHAGGRSRIRRRRTRPAQPVGGVPAH